MLSFSSASSNRLTTESLRYSSIIIVGISLGIASSIYSPLMMLGITFVFTISSFMLYTTSYYRRFSENLLPELPVETPIEQTNNSFLCYLFYLSFFISTTIPKSGKTIGSIPVTAANILILGSLSLWFIHFLFSQKIKIPIPVFKPIIIFIFYGIISAILGIANRNNPKYLVLEFVAFIGFIPIYFLTCSIVRTKRQIHVLIWAILLSFMLVCGYGMLQIKLGFATVAVPGITEQYGLIQYEPFGGRWNIIEGGYKLYSTFQNGNILGNHLATFIPFLGGILLSTRSAWKKTIVSGLFLLACYTLVLTYSRGAVVGALSGIIVFIVLSRRNLSRLIIVVIILVAVISIFLYQYADRPEMNRFNLHRVAKDPNQFSAGRLKRVEQVLLTFKKFSLIKKLFGVGLGGSILSPLYWHFQLVDNLYLSFLFKIGIVGLALFLWALVRLFLKLLVYRAEMTDLQMQGLLNGGIAGLFGSLVHNLADALWFFPPLAANFWFLAGMTMCIATIGVNSSKFEHNLP